MSQVQDTQNDNSSLGQVTRRPSLPLGLRIMCSVLKTVNGFARRKDGTFNRTLMNFLEYKSPPNLKPERGVYTKDVVIDTHTGVWVRLFIPVANEVNGSEPTDAENKKSGSIEEQGLPIVFYFHGGAFAVLSADFILYDVFCRRLARRRRVIVISVDYRRVPEYRYPIPYEDCFGVFNWVRSQGQIHLPPNADLSRCFLMGDSAGGNIVHHLGCRVLSGEDISPVRIVGHVLIQPYFGGEERTSSELRLVNDPIVSIESADWHWRAFLPEGANRDHPAANVFGPNAADISALPLPPTLVVIGGHDPLQDWQLRYVDNLKKLNKDAGHIFYEDGVHAFHIFFQLDLSSKFISDLDAFFQKCGI